MINSASLSILDSLGLFRAEHREAFYGLGSPNLLSNAKSDIFRELSWEAEVAPTGILLIDIILVAFSAELIRLG